MPQWFHWFQWGTVVAWVGAGVTVWKAIIARSAAKKAEASARSAENEATWRITWGKPGITWGASPRDKTSYWLSNMTKSTKYGVSVEAPAGTDKFAVIAAEGREALNQQKETDQLFKVTWHVTAEEMDPARTVKVRAY